MKRLTVLCLIACCAALPAQANKQDPAQKRMTKLRRVLENMTKAQSLEFSTRHQVAAQNQMVAIRGRAGAARKGSAVKASGVWAGDVLYHKCNKGKDEVLVSGRRRIARSGDDWQFAAHNKLAKGTTPPFLLDPELLFRALAHRPLQISKNSVGTFDQKPVEIYTLTFKDKDAEKLLRTGICPDFGGNTSFAGGGGIVVFGGGGAIGGGGGKSKSIMDIALFVEPGQGVIQHVKIRCYQDNPLAKMMKVRVLRAGGGGGDDDEEEEETEEADAGEPVFKDGLPVRKLKDMSTSKFDITLKNLNSATLPELSKQAKKLLGL